MQVCVCVCVSVLMYLPVPKWQEPELLWSELFLSSVDGAVHINCRLLRQRGGERGLPFLSARGGVGGGLGNTLLLPFP